MEHATGSYDFVVVGAGTAGCVLAARLSENGAARVLLLEAGDREPLDVMSVPPAWPALQGTSADWAGTTIVQSATGTAMAWPRGRALGGSSAINGMNFVRGHRSSYDAWAEAGATGWGFDDLLPYFRRSENATGRDPAVRGDRGPLTVGPAVARHPVAAAGLEAAAQAGYRRAADISGGLEEGFGWCDLNIADGRRQSARDAYLAPALSRPNLDVVTGALVHRVSLEGDRCTGVSYSVGSAMYSARCTGEVVLAAGTVGSAQLLLLSGIGPQSDLRSVGIEVAAELPGVGANLFDHPMSGVVYRSARPVPAGQNNHGEALGLIRSDPGADTPDLQVMFVDVPLRAETLPGPAMGEGYTLATSLMLPRSRGTVRLASAEPGTPPLIDPNYYADPCDLHAFAAGLRAAREIGRAAALDEWRGAEVLPGPAADDDASLRAYLRRDLRTYAHPGGTCRIGTDADAVVDTELRVRGISARIAGVLAPSGTAEPVDGGYRVTGRWEWCTGCLHAQWALLGIPLTDDSGQLSDQGFVLVPMSELTIEDTWFVAGMRGTGSNTVVADGVFVPAHRYVSGFKLLSGANDNPHKDEALYRAPFMPGGTIILAGPHLGLARAALDLVTDKAARRGIAYTFYDVQRDAPSVQLAVAKAASLADTAELLAYRAAAEVDDAGRRNSFPGYLARAKTRMDTVQAIVNAREAIRELVSAHGASAFAEASPLQRIWRDSEVASRHAIANAGIGAEVYGRALLGFTDGVTPLI
jgi:choline dehydrogenase-like flavoprotein